MKILVHITHGPEAPTRAALGFHVASAALDEGHTVTVFLAGDAVQLLRGATSTTSKASAPDRSARSSTPLPGVPGSTSPAARARPAG